MERMKADKIRSHSRLIAKLGKAQFCNDLRHHRLAYCPSGSPNNVFVPPDAQSVTPRATSGVSNMKGGETGADRKTR
ncbi:hypothetical protein [Treponema endosymbiont of Eucomonympha sp.]|uniref:hypothetical protein n=1 Tax=Treponema endosymbiont of Eucomonympha sp. TaxID=1580831 RepID=UPI001396AC76|nr:hypothetical protein [Treponema endosymbiont of Eucomonympha sp.]